jgi:hypothetical protein
MKVNSELITTDHSLLTMAVPLISGPGFLFIRLQALRTWPVSTPIPTATNGLTAMAGPLQLFGRLKKQGECAIPLLRVIAHEKTARAIYQTFLWNVTEIAK